jgi:hypothetical protein
VGTALAIGTKPPNMPDDLVTWNDRQLRVLEVPIDDVEIRATHAATFTSTSPALGEGVGSSRCRRGILGLSSTIAFMASGTSSHHSVAAESPQPMSPNGQPALGAGMDADGSARKGGKT